MYNPLYTMYIHYTHSHLHTSNQYVYYVACHLISLPLTPSPTASVYIVYTIYSVIAPHRMLHTHTHLETHQHIACM